MLTANQFIFKKTAKSDEVRNINCMKKYWQIKWLIEMEI